MKTKSLSIKAIEHLLLDLGYKSDHQIDVLMDAPYLILKEGRIEPIYSNSKYVGCSEKSVNEHRVLSLRPSIGKIKLSKFDEKVIKLVTSLNSNKNMGLSGYNVAFNYDLSDGTGIKRTKIYPVTDTAGGGISVETIKFIIEYSDKNQLDAYFTYCNIHEENKRYGTYTPCVCFY